MDFLSEFMVPEYKVSIYGTYLEKILLCIVGNPAKQSSCQFPL